VSAESMSRIVGQSSASRKILFVFLLAGATRLIGWQVMPVVYGDTVGFIMHGAGADVSSWTEPGRQEPLHPALIRWTHNILFRGKDRAKVIDPDDWAFSAFLVGLTFTAICMWVLFALGKQLHSTTAGLWAAFFLAVQPYGIRYSTNGLSELPFMAFVLLAVYLVIRASENKRWILTVGGVCTFLAFLVRKEAIVLPAAVILYFLLQRDNRFVRRMAALSLFVLGTACGAGLYLLIGGRFDWCLAPLEFLNWERVTEKIFTAGGTEGFVPASLPISKPYELFIPPLWSWVKMSGFLPAILFVGFLFRRGRVKLNRGWSLVGWFLVGHLALCFALLSGTGLFVSRYLFPASVIVFPISAAAMVEVIKHLSVKYDRLVDNPFAHIIPAVALTVVLVPQAYQWYLLGHRSEVRLAADWLRANTSRDAVIFTTDSRVGFYSQREWKLFPNWLTPYNAIKQSVKTGLGRVYFAFRGRKYNNRRLGEWLTHVGKRKTLKAESVRTFYGPTGEVAIYRLRAGKR